MKKIVKRVLAIVLCVCLSLGVFDGVWGVNNQEVKAAVLNWSSYAYDGCVHWVKHRASQLGIVLPNTGYNKYGLPGASAWWSVLPRSGYSTSNVPVANSVAVWEFGYQGSRYGHVAYIESVSGDSVTFTDGGWSGGYSYQGNSGVNITTTSKNRMSTINGNSGFLGYVYLKGSTPTYTLTANSATSITNNSAKVSGSLNPSGTVASWGFSLSTNNKKFQDYQVGTNVASAKMSCDIGKHVKLKYGTTYYYKLYANIAGKTVRSTSAKSFKTTATKPNIPTLKISSDNADIGLETSPTVTWSGISGANYYKLYLYDEDHNLVQTSNNVTGTKYAFSGLKKTGKYYASIEAYNEVGTKGKSKEVTISVHPDVTVTFMDADSFVDVEDDYEPEELGKQTIHYGGTANAPAKPEHTGYTFKKWSDTYSKVKEDITIKAVYDINEYTVKYIDSTTSKQLGTEKVTYYSSANPVDYDVPTGYVKTGYDGWDKDYKKITENTTLYTCIGWYNDNFPIYAQILSAVREYDAEESDNEGYTIQAKVTNWDKSTTKGRVVVALKTKEGKLLTSTESSAFSVKKSKDKTIEVFVPYDKAASVAEVYVVGQYTDAVPITTATSNNASLEIDQSNVYTNWSTEKPPAGVKKQETRTEYRYKDKIETTSKSTSLAGYTCSGSKWVQSGTGHLDYVASFPAGFSTSSSIYKAYKKNPYTASENTTKKRTVKNTRIGYVYYHWCRNGSYSGSLKNRTVNGSYTSKFFNFHAFVQSGALGWNSAGAFYADLPSQCGDSYWWIGNGEGNNSQIPIYRSDYYDYYKLFTYYKWTDFTDWSTDKPTSSATRTVENRTVHRYISDEMLAEDDSGKERTIKGTVGSEFAGKEAALFIYKVDGASDYTNEYVAQTKLDDEGNYSFKFKLREEPSVKTGDYTVVLGIEGTSTAIYLDTIEAPKQTFKVRFLDYDGKVISEQDVEKGKAAELPDQEKTQRTGYTFTKWSDTNINIEEDKDIYAEYELNQYDVVFVDWRANTVQVQKFEYGARLTTPEAEEPDEGEVVEWDKIAEGVDTVTENMVVCTQYKTRTFDVKIYGIDGKIISEQTIDYGKAVVLPEINEEENDCYFYGWTNVAEGEESFEDTIIRDETTLKPKFSYRQTVEMPTVSVAGGEYKKEQKVSLSTGTQNAKIYFTLDGTDPFGPTKQVYTGPITIKDATILKYCAVADKMNDSSVGTEYYVVNYEGARSEWMPYADLPSEVKENQSAYQIFSDTGYSFKNKREIITKSDKEILEKAGWTEDSSTWSDYSEWQNEAKFENGDYIEYEIDSQPVYATTSKYEYSHYVYEDNGNTIYSPNEVEGFDCKYETIVLESSMAIAGFTEEGTTYFIRDGVNWYNQKKTTGKSEVGTQYRIRHKIFTYMKWSDYTTDIPGESVKAEYKTAEVFSYVRHNKYIVTLQFEDGIPISQIVEEGKKLDSGSIEDVEGYTMDGIYQDETYSTKWEIDKDVVTKSMILYIKLKPKKYTVKFYSKRGAIESQVIADYGTEAIAPEMKNEGDEVFVKWDTNDYICVCEDLEIRPLYVNQEDFATIHFSQSELKLNKNETTRLEAEISPLSMSEETVIWDTEDYDVAYVSDDGLVTANGTGTTTITATVESSGQVAKCKVVVDSVQADPANSEEIKKQETKDTRSSTLEKQNEQQTATTDGGKTSNESTDMSKNSNNSALGKVNITSLKNKVSCKLTAKWKKVSDATGYQLQYALNKKFTKAKKSKTTKKTSLTLKKLKKKKTYFIRVRAYKLSDKKKVYGKWSAVKKVKIKK